MIPVEHNSNLNSKKRPRRTNCGRFKLCLCSEDLSVNSIGSSLPPPYHSSQNVEATNTTDTQCAIPSASPRATDTETPRSPGSIRTIRAVRSIPDQTKTPSILAFPDDPPSTLQRTPLTHPTSRPHPPLAGPIAPNRPLLPRTCHASHVGARPINDALPKRRLRAIPNKKRHSTGQHVAMGVFDPLPQRAEA